MCVIRMRVCIWLYTLYTTYLHELQPHSMCTHMQTHREGKRDRHNQTAPCMNCKLPRYRTTTIIYIRVRACVYMYVRVYIEYARMYSSDSNINIRIVYLRTDVPDSRIHIRVYMYIINTCIYLYFVRSSEYNEEEKFREYKTTTENN